MKLNGVFRCVGAAVALAVCVTVQAAPEDQVAKPVKTAVQSVRYSKDELALKQLAAEHQARFLAGDAWQRASPAQRKEFVDLFHSLLARIAFPKIRENFRNLASIRYETPEIRGDEANVRSTIVIDHPMKKQAMSVTYQLVRDKAAWKIVDVAVTDDSMLTGIRDDQVQPLLKEGGWDLLLRLMREKERELARK